MKSRLTNMLNTKENLWGDLDPVEITRLLEDIEAIMEVSDQDISQENANLDGSSVSAKQHLIAGAVVKYRSMKMLDDTVKEKFLEGSIHIHDFDYYALGTKTCTQIRLGEVLSGGFETNNTFLREPSSIGVATTQAAIIFGANQNCEHGRITA